MVSGFSRVTHRRPAAGARPAAAITILLLMFVASANVQPAEWDPAHMHIVIGGSDLDNAHALAAHLAQTRLHPESDGREHPLAHPGHGDRSCSDPDNQTHVLSIRAGDALGIATFGGGDALAGSAVPAILPPVDRPDRVSLLAHVAIPDPQSALPEPPPRAS